MRVTASRSRFTPGLQTAHEGVGDGVGQPFRLFGRADAILELSIDQERGQTV